MDISALLESIRLLAGRTHLPDGTALIPPFRLATDILETLPPAIRPPASDGNAGGLIELSPTMPTLILPDLHARPGLLIDLLETTLEPNGPDVLTLLDQQRIQIVMLGDGPHTEGPAAMARWRLAWEEFQASWATSAAMTEEMTLAFNAMEITATLIASFPGAFFFLKGNHDNILNEEGNGNHPFGKYAYEGQMAFQWTTDFLGAEFVMIYDEFERALPLVARGKGFLAMHAEPIFAITPEDAIEARLRPEIVEALTWTNNDAADTDSVTTTLAAFLQTSDKPGIAFGGHRPVSERFALRSGGLFVQIHDQQEVQAALVYPGRAFDPISGIIRLGAHL